MASFYRFYESMEDDDFSAATETVRTGMDFGEFWDNFMSLCNNNADGLAELFDVPRYKVSNWSAKIMKARDKVNALNNVPDKAKVIKTGDVFKWE